MYPASYVYIILILHSIITKKNAKEIFVWLIALYAFTYISVDAGHFMDAYGIRLSYDKFVQIILLLFTLIMLANCIFQRCSSLLDLKHIVLALACVAVGIGNLLLKPANVLVIGSEVVPDAVWLGRAKLHYPMFSRITISTFIAYGVFLFILYTVFLVFTYDDYIHVLKIFVRYSKIVVVLGYIEFLSKLFISSQSYMNLVIAFFGKNSSVSFGAVDQLRNNLPILFGWTAEPSGLAYNLFVIMVAMLAQNSIDKRHGKWITASGILLIFTGAFSALLFVVIYAAILYVYTYKETRYYMYKIFCFAGISMIVAAVMWFIASRNMFAGSFFGERLINIFHELPMLLTLDVQDISSLEYNSYRVRLGGSFSTLRLLLYRPLFGLGIGTLSSHGSSSTILSSIGIIGVYTWLKAVFGGKARKFFNVNIRAYRMVIIIWFVMGIFVGRFFGMLYGGENFILIIAYAVICSNSKKSRGRIMIADYQIAGERGSKHAKEMCKY